MYKRIAIVRKVRFSSKSPINVGYYFSVELYLADLK